jgi:hypothetical protein
MNYEIPSNFECASSIAIVGNAVGNIDPFNEIDAFDCVVRLNGGFLIPQDGFRGTKTTVVCTSSIECLQRLKGTSIVKIWMTPKNRNIIDSSLYGEVFYYPEEWWACLQNILNSRPSTGIMAIDYFVKKMRGRRIKIFGYNFYQSKNFNGRGKGFKCPHNFVRERELVESFIENKNCDFQPVTPLNDEGSLGKRIWSFFR